MDTLITATHPDPARASIARELANFYAELAGFDDRPPEPFSVARAIRQAAAGRPLQGREREVCGATESLLGRTFLDGRLTIPLAALTTRGLGVSGTGGYLAGARTTPTVDTLAPFSVVVDGGISIMEGLREDVAVPRVVAAGSAAWLAPGDQLPDADPTVGSASATPRLGGAIIKLSAQFMRQGVEAEEFLRRHLLRAAGRLLDAALFSGRGGKEPVGIYRTPGVHEQSGTSLDRADLLEMREAALVAGARESALRWFGDPATQELLAARVGVANTPSYLWADDGTILGARAVATPAAAYITDAAATAAALCVGDFSAATLCFWGPASLQVSVDPHNSFANGGVAVRVLVSADLVIAQPGAFAAAVNIT